MRRLSLVALLLFVPVPGAAQPADTAEIPRTPWGRPDLGGVWTNSTLTPLERPEGLGEREFHTAAEVAELQRVAVQERIDALPEPEATLAVEFSEVWMEPGPLSGRTSLVKGSDREDSGLHARRAGAPGRRSQTAAHPAGRLA